MKTPRATAARPARTDAGDTRSRLLRAGLRLFAEHGYARTSTRELAEAAQVNIAAISYYFGDKAGLYRAVFFEPLDAGEAPEGAFAAPGLTLEQALSTFFEELLEPLRQGETAQLCMKLRFREMLEPTGLWQEDITQGIKPLHDALQVVLERELGLDTADDELRGLVVAIAALGVHLHVAHDVIEVVAPRLIPAPDTLDAWRERLTRYALAMVDAERARRGFDAAAPSHPRTR